MGKELVLTTFAPHVTYLNLINGNGNIAHQGWQSWILFNRTRTPTNAQRASPFSAGYPYYDYYLTLPGVEPRTIRLLTGSYTNPLMSGVFFKSIAHQGWQSWIYLIGPEPRPSPKEHHRLFRLSILRLLFDTPRG